MSHDDWLDDAEYPDDRDIARFGEDSPPDDDPLTIGYVGEGRASFWTPGRLVVAVVVALVLLSILVVAIAPLFSR